MDYIKKINAQVDKLIKEYEALKSENSALKIKLEDIQKSNDEIVQNNQDMLFKIGKVMGEKETNIPYK